MKADLWSAFRVFCSVRASRGNRHRVEGGEGPYQEDRDQEAEEQDYQQDSSCQEGQSTNLPLRTISEALSLTLRSASLF